MRYLMSLSQKLNRRNRVVPRLHKVPEINSQGDAHSVVLRNRLMTAEKPACLNLKTEYSVDHVWSTGGGCGELNSEILLLSLL